MQAGDVVQRMQRRVAQQEVQTDRIIFDDLLKPRHPRRHETLAARPNLDWGLRRAAVGQAPRSQKLLDRLRRYMSDERSVGSLVELGMVVELCALQRETTLH